MDNNEQKQASISIDEAAMLLGRERIAVYLMAKNMEQMQRQIDSLHKVLKNQTEEKK